MISDFDHDPKADTGVAQTLMVSLIVSIVVVPKDFIWYPEIKIVKIMQIG
ncbi:hypothetical protein [Robertkochia aurantiaca]|nr:hypothetical protein [Robertkochia sp. 3YJGBD-33]